MRPRRSQPAPAWRQPSQSSRQRKGRGRAASRVAGAGGTVATPDMPVPTAATAMEFAKLLSAGVSPDQALLFIPGATAYAESLQVLKGRLRAAAFHDWLGVWLGSRLVADAVDEARGGKWQDLPREKQAELALDKHIAEVALYVLQNQYEGMPMDRAADARKTLTAYLAEKRGVGEASALLSFVKSVMDGEATVSRSVYKETAKVEISAAKAPVRPVPSPDIFDVSPVERKRLQ